MAWISIDGNAVKHRCPLGAGTRVPVVRWGLRPSQGRAVFAGIDSMLSGIGHGACKLPGTRFLGFEPTKRCTPGRVHLMPIGMGGSTLRCRSRPSPSPVRHSIGGDDIIMIKCRRKPQNLHLYRQGEDGLRRRRASAAMPCAMLAFYPLPATAPGQSVEKRTSGAHTFPARFPGQWVQIAQRL